ncbi:hypothetical protein BGZ58_006839, partial [Dissophora ornata]
AIMGVLSILGIISFVLRIVYLKSQCKPHGLGRTAWIFWPTQFCMSGAALLAIIGAVFTILERKDLSPAAILGYLAVGGAWSLAVLLNYYEHLYSIRSSDFIFSFYILTIAALSIHARTLSILVDTWTEASRHLTIISNMTGILVLGFTIEAWPRERTNVQQASSAPIYEKANLFGQVTYYFYQPIITLSVKRTLTFSDVANQLPEAILTRNCQARLDYFWTKALRRANASRQKVVGWGYEKLERESMPPLLFRAVMRSHLPNMPEVVALRLGRVAANYAVPAILSLLLAYFQDVQRESESRIGDRSDSETSLSYGLMLVVGMLLAGLANAVLLVVSRQYCIMLGLETRSALMSMIYRKSLRLSPGARQESTTGSITNYMSVDADLWGEGGIFLTMGISIPAEIAVGLWLLYRLLGWSAWVGVLAIVAMLPLQIWRAKIFGKMKRERWTHMDERIRLTTESLSAIKVVKLYSWEGAFLKKILNIRNLELEVQRRMGVLSAVMSIVYSSSTVIICLVTLSFYAVWGGPGFTPAELTPQIVFVSMAILAMLKTPIWSATEASSAVISLLVSTRRIQDFLLMEETDTDAIIRERDISRREPREPLVLIKDGTFSWTRTNATVSGLDESNESDELAGLLSGHEGGSRENTPTLENITLSVGNGYLVAVVGRVGQGKSSLLSAIIGEMYKSQGYVKTIGRIAYVPQQAWILNATLRENILFGKEFDHDRYYRILHACGLEPDVEMLPAGDSTEIGERGINLSGGQKQRVSLARAAYDDADIYLLDDPLSAVDAHVDSHLWTNLIGPEGLLGRKTRILVTHGIRHLKEVDRVVLIKKGQVVEDGRFDELMATAGIFHQLIKEYSVTHRNHIANLRADRAEEGTPESSTAAQYVEDLDTTSQTSTESGTILDASKDKAQRDSTKKNTSRDSNARITTDEKVEVGNVRMSVVKAYIGALSYKYAALVIVLHVLTQICLVSTNLWLKHWITMNEQVDKEHPPSLKLFILVFAMLTLAHIATCIALFWIAFAVAGVRASEHLHRKLMVRVMRLPPAFFDTTPLGRIISRVSSDLASIDDRLPWKFFEVTLQGASLLASLTIVATTTPVFLFASPFIFIAYYIAQNYYLHASQACKRMFRITNSPIYQHFQETLGGVSTIRAMGLQGRFIRDNAVKCDLHSNAFVAFGYCIRWVEIQTQVISCLITLMASLWFVLSTKKNGDGGERSVAVDAATAGLALSFSMNISQSLIWFTRTYCDLYTHLISVERVQELTELRTEAPLRTDPNSEAGRALEQKLWPPQQGGIQFLDYSTRYREGLDLVLKHLSFTVAAGEKVGIVGRTGAGKSSLTLALFRMVEAANSYWAKASDNSGRAENDVTGSGEGDRQVNENEDEMNGGRIEIDGIDISTLGLADLRQQLAIIPQEPILFAGTVRENLDPFQELEEAVLWEALERAHLKSHISSLSGGLSYQVSQNGENFSVGQRSLMCLARALLRKSKILILDEATSAVDVETDELIQKTIRAEFKERTILTIAHRVKTVMDSDKILVLDQGSVVEYESPKVLLKDDTSLFYKLAKQAGEL